MAATGKAIGEMKARVNVPQIAPNRLQAFCVPSIVGCLTASNAMFYVTSFTSTPSLQRSCSAGSDGSDLLLTVPLTKFSLTFSTHTYALAPEARWLTKDLAQHAEGRPHSDERPELLQPQTV